MKSRMLPKTAGLTFGLALFFAPPLPGGAAFFFEPPPSVWAEEASQRSTLQDAKQEASQEAAKSGDHAENLKEGVKKDTKEAGRTLKKGAKSGFSILKDGVRSLWRGEGVKAKKSAREEQDPQDP